MALQAARGFCSLALACNAINDIIDKQYGELYHYNAIVRMDPDVADAEKNAVAKRVEATPKVQKHGCLPRTKLCALRARRMKSTNASS